MSLGLTKNLPLSCNLFNAKAVAGPCSEDIKEPFNLEGISPLYGLNYLNLWFITADSADAVRLLFLNPIKPLAGISNS